MNVRIEGHKWEEFEPIKLEIAIETPDELRELWHRLNVDLWAIAVVEYSPTGCKYPTGEACVYKLWKAIDKMADERGVK